MKKPDLKIGTLDLIQTDVPYLSDVSALYAALCHQNPYSLLLESAEIESKKNIQSLMLIDAAVRIVCHGQEVELQAITQNGINLLNALEAHFKKAPLKNKKHNVSATRNKTSLFLYVDNTASSLDKNECLDEDARLCQPSSLDALRVIQQAFQLDDPALPDDAIFIAGLFAYDLVAQFETLPEIEPSKEKEKSAPCPDYVFYVAQTLLVFDHKQRKAKLQGVLFGGENHIQMAANIRGRLDAIKNILLDPPPSMKGSVLSECNVNVSVSDLDFCKNVDALKHYISNGDVFQVVPSRIFTLPCPSPFNAYIQLKKDNPSPYMFYMQDRDFILFGASPESALKYTKRTNQVEIYPIAGTRPRGKNEDGSINLDLDGRIELELRNDIKENAEHMMLVDLARNDIARISEPGTRYVADLLNVDRYSHVMHLVSRVIGQLRGDLDALHAYQACMNMGTLTGAPKIRAMQLIRQFEKKRRGSYGGAVGYITGRGDMDTCIVIRAAFVENNIAHVQAGAGVVFDSDPKAETCETTSKAQAVLNAIIKAHKGDIG